MLSNTHQRLAICALKKFHEVAARCQKGAEYGLKVAPVRDQTAPHVQKLRSEAAKKLHLKRNKND